MPPTVNPSRSGKSPIRGTHIITILMFIVTLGSGLASWWITSTRAAAEKPVIALGTLIGDIRSFHNLVGGFPVDLNVLQEQIWTPRGKGGYKFSEQNHSFVVGNYYYLYAPVGPHEARVWAVPLGQYRSQFSTYYAKVVHSAPAPDIWQGPALDYEEVKKITAVMQDAELINLGLTLQSTPAQTSPGQPSTRPTAPGQAAPAQNSPAAPRPPSDSPFRFTAK